MQLNLEPLNSDRIKDRYGNYGIAVIAQDRRLRRSSLYSVTDGERTSRTHAVVEFVADSAAAVQATHARVLAGGSIGATFRDAGWAVHKRTVYIGDFKLSDSRHPIATRMRLSAPATLALHAYQLHIERDDSTLHYATIVELHHPDYLSRTDLLDIYRQPQDGGLSATDIEALTALVLAGD